ncbi:hypothetical protein J2Z60_001350 [Lactobacillus colini]|uniref:EF-hand domain-containing protein n=1 Tax=Lactobacillus colini TaxID=1819254 RepID=A0ABS4MER9_9LACO|nr:hypothetical protein [Lactobacillus colini]MBP2058173.1 hypothetical protein [Lactobacillus colini]
MTNNLHAENPEDLNIGIVLQYNIADKGAIDADNLVRYARDCGFRGVSINGADELQTKLLKQSCQTYSLKFCQARSAIKLEGPDILSEIMIARNESRNIYFEIDLNQDGQIDSDEVPAMDNLRQWIGRFGHAFYEARPTKEISTNSNAYIFKNAIAPYQIYIFIHQPLADKITLNGVPEIKRAIWIDTRKELNFNQDGNQITIDLPREDDDLKFTIYGLRLEAHRPEDDMGPTEF